MLFNLFSLLNRPDEREGKILVDKLHDAGITQEDVHTAVEAVLSGVLDGNLSVQELKEHLMNIPKHASYGCTQRDIGDASPYTFPITGHTGGTTRLIPPVSMSSNATSTPSGFVKLSQFGLLESIPNGFSSDNGDLVALEGTYGTFHAKGWGNFRHSQNNATVGFVFGVDVGGVIYFSPRVTSNKMPNTNDVGIIAGNGEFVLQEGYRLSTWVASDKEGNLTIPNANIIVNRVSIRTDT